MKICIHIISSRVNCLKLSLQSFYKYFNNKYKLPVYIYHFDDIYSKSYIDDINNTIDKNIKFIQIDYGLPKNLNYNDIYFIKKGVPNRLGYHHMCHFWSNYYHYPKTEYTDYDIAFNFDDDSLWTKEFDFSFFEKLIKSESVLMCFNCYKYQKNHRSREVRTGLCDLVCNYCKKYNIVPKKKWLQELLNIKDKLQRDDFFQTHLICYDTNITKLKIFDTKEHKNWMHDINESNGIYKYRWGDNEVLSLYHDIHYDTDVLLIDNIKTAAGLTTSYINPGGLRHITDYAPSITFPMKIRKF